MECPGSAPSIVLRLKFATLAQIYSRPPVNQFLGFLFGVYDEFCAHGVLSCLKHQVNQVACRCRQSGKTLGSCLTLSVYGVHAASCPCLGGCCTMVLQVTRQASWMTCKGELKIRGLAKEKMHVSERKAEGKRRRHAAPQNLVLPSSQLIWPSAGAAFLRPLLGMSSGSILQASQKNLIWINSQSTPFSSPIFCLLSSLIFLPLLASLFYFFHIGCLCSLVTLMHIA